jgi:hypothetical protein
MFPKLLNSGKNKYSEMKSQSLRSIETFINDFIDAQAKLLTDNPHFKTALDEFSKSVGDINILDSYDQNVLKVERASQKLTSLDYPIRCAFYVELLDALGFSPFISMLGDEVFQRVLFKLEKETDYEKFDKIFKEMIDKKPTSNIVEPKDKEI